MKQQIEQAIASAIHTLYGHDETIILTSPPTKELGDYATNVAFSLAKSEKKAPMQIAEAIKEEIVQSDLITKVAVIHPGFINIFVNKDAFATSLINDILHAKEDYVLLYPDTETKISIEHTAANPNKHLHVGHLRNFSIADTLVRIYKKIGYEVVVQYFNNNQGLQIAKVVWGFRNLDKLHLQHITDDSTIAFDTIAAKVYVAAEKYLSEEPSYETEVRDIIKQMEHGHNEMATYSEEVTKNILLGQLQTVFTFGVFYDEIITESSMTQSGQVERIIADLMKSGKVVKETTGKNAGCIVIKGIEGNDGEDIPEKVLIRADGTAVYTGKDIVLHLWKFGLMDVSFSFVPLIKQKNNKDVYISVTDGNNAQEIKESADLHINVVDQRQAYPLQVVKESLRLLGFEKEANAFHHLGYETVTISLESAKQLGVDTSAVTTKWIAMSGRKGIEIPINSILEKMTQMVLEKNKDKAEALSYDEAKHIAASALRYYMIKYAYNTIIVFDIDDALNPNGDSGIYLMYAYVRSKKILDKLQIKDVSHIHTQMTDIPEEIDSLLMHLSYVRDVIETSAKDFKVNVLAEYTYELAKRFSHFYQAYNIINEKDSEKKRVLYCNSPGFCLCIYCFVRNARYLSARKDLRVKR